VSANETRGPPISVSNLLRADFPFHHPCKGSVPSKTPTLVGSFDEFKVAVAHGAHDAAEAGTAIKHGGEAAVDIMTKDAVAVQEAMYKKGGDAVEALEAVEGAVYKKTGEVLQTITHSASEAGAGVSKAADDVAVAIKHDVAAAQGVVYKKVGEIADAIKVGAEATSASMARAVAKLDASEKGAQSSVSEAPK
jgi:hypothetical protein